MPRAPLETGGRSKSAHDEAEYLAWLKGQAQTSEVVAASADDDDNEEDDDLVEDAGDWDEAKHPRDERGRFGEGGAGGPTHGREQPHGRTLTKGGLRPRQAAPENPARPPEAPHPTHLDELHFSSTMVDPAASMNFEKVVGKFEHPELARWLEEPGNQPRLEIVPEVDKTEAERTEGGRLQGLYWPPRMTLDGDQSVPRIQVAVGAGYPHIGSDLRDWGDVWGVAEHQESVKNAEGFATGKFEYKSPSEYFHEVFLHELGHHIEMGPAGMRHESDGPERRIRDVVNNAYGRLGLDELKPTVSPPMIPLREKVLRGESPSPAISRYAVTNPHEYFAESFNAYVSHPAALEKYDPNGYAMVKTVLGRLGIEGQPAAGGTHSGAP